MSKKSKQTKSGISHTSKEYIKFVLIQLKREGTVWCFGIVYTQLELNRWRIYVAIIIAHDIINFPVYRTKLGHWYRKMSKMRSRNIWMNSCHAHEKVWSTKCSCKISLAPANERAIESQCSAIENRINKLWNPTGQNWQSAPLGRPNCCSSFRMVSSSTLYLALLLTMKLSAAINAFTSDVSGQITVSHNQYCKKEGNYYLNQQQKPSSPLFGTGKKWRVSHALRTVGAENSYVYTFSKNVLNDHARKDLNTKVWLEWSCEWDINKVTPSEWLTSWESTPTSRKSHSGASRSPQIRNRYKLSGWEERRL